MEKQTTRQGVGKRMRKYALFFGGFILVVAGMALVLGHWQALVTVFAGTVPAAIAVAGLVIMFAASIKK